MKGRGRGRSPKGMTRERNRGVRRRPGSRTSTTTISPRDLSPQDSTSGDLGCLDHTPKDLTPHALSPQGHTPQVHTPEVFGCQDHTPKDLTPHNLSPQVRTPQDHIPQVLDLQDLTPQNLTPQVHTPHVRTLQVQTPKDDNCQDSILRDPGCQDLTSNDVDKEAVALAEEFLHYKKTCSACKCPREEHEVVHVEWVNVKERLGFKPSADPDKRNSRERSHGEGYAWVPPGLPSYKIDQYFGSLPPNKVPKLGTAGEKYRDKQLVVQLPKQDLALTYCKHVDPEHYNNYEDFVNARNEIALDIAYAKEVTTTTECAKCKETIHTDDIAILAPKLGDQLLWHPGCFVCTTCDQLLVDLTYCVYFNQLYCERHYSEQLKPRCSACDEVSKLFIQSRVLGKSGLLILVVVH